MPNGIIPRMRLLAIGWSKASDQFAAATDSQWWAKKYSGPLWAPLLTWYGLLEKTGIVASWNWDPDIAAGNPLAIGYSIASAQSDLDVIVKAGRSKCAPYLVPQKTGSLPLPNPVCVPDKVIDEPGRVVDIVRTATTIPWWLWAIIGAAVAVQLRKRD